MALTRGIHADTLAAINTGRFHPVTLVYINWPGGAVRVHSGHGPLSWDSESWTGVGPLEAALQLPGEAGGTAMIEGTASVGADDDTIDDLYTDADDARGVAVQVWCGVVTARAGTTLIGEPFEVWSGRVGGTSDEAAWQGDSMMRPFSIGLVSGPSQRATGSAVHSYEDQLRRDPTDTAGRLVSGALTNTIKTISNV